MTATLRAAWDHHGIPRHAQPWLIYLIVLAFQPAFEPGPAVVAWSWVAVLIAAFLPIYAWTTRRLDRRPDLWKRGPGAITGLAGLVALGVLGSTVNSGATVFLVFAASMAGRLPRRHAVPWIAVASVAVVGAGLLSTIPLEYRLLAFGPVAVLTPFLGMASVFEAERTRADAKLRMAQGEIERLATVAERERIARDLHDLLGHTLSTITLKAELAGRLAAHDAERAAGEVADIERISREALADVRSTVRGYRGHGLQGELANARLALEAADVEFDYYLADVALRPGAEAVVALALREGVTNVVRHASAQTCRVTLERDRNWLVLTIDDDGIGHEGASALGSGLSAMNERIRGLGGRLTVEPSRHASSAGTRLDIALPWDRVRGENG